MNIKTLKVTLTFLTVCLLGTAVKAQQDPQFSMNVATRLQVNPAFAGMNDGICANLLSRQQWVGFEGRPETYLFGAHGTFTIPGINLRSGGGLTIISEGLGQTRFAGFKGAYSAHIPLKFIGGKPGHLGIGVAAGLMQYSVGSNWRSLTDYWLDPLIPDQGYEASAFDLDAGIYYKSQDVYFGVSATHLTAPSLAGNGQADNNGTDWATEYNYQRHFHLIAGYDYAIPSYNLLVLQPSVFVKTELTSAQFDINLLAEWNNFLWGGVTYRFIDAAVVMAGLKYNAPIGTFKGGYAYDITTSRINAGSNGSHEVFLQYCMKLKPVTPVQKHKTVRFL